MGCIQICIVLHSMYMVIYTCVPFPSPKYMYTCTYKLGRPLLCPYKVIFKVPLFIGGIVVHSVCILSGINCTCVKHAVTGGGKDMCYFSVVHVLMYVCYQ